MKVSQTAADILSRKNNFNIKNRPHEVLSAWPKPSNEPLAQSSKVVQMRVLVNPGENPSMLCWLLICLLCAYH